MTSWVLEVPGTLTGDRLDDLQLSGTRCDRCGRVYFPARRNCPRCLDDSCIRQVPLRTEGTLQSFSIASIAPPGFPVPHAQGYIDLSGNGPRIFSLLTDYGDGSSLRVGCGMVLTIAQLGKDKEDRVIVGYRFRPLGAGDKGGTA
jgi:uncharacterized OB-fold protein